MNFLFLDTIGYESAIRLSGHHYARLLAERGHRVLSLSAPVSPLHHLARRNRPAIRRRFENHREGFVPAPGGVLHYVPWSPLPVKNVWPLDRMATLRFSATSFKRDVLRRLNDLAFVPDVVSIQNLTFFPLLDEFPSAVIQYRMTDRMDAFGDYPASLLAAERQILRTVDIISITSKQFLEFLDPSVASKALYAPNGVDVGHFSLARPQPALYRKLGSPVAVYVGALRDWFDWDLLKKLAQTLREVCFVVISPDPPREDLRAEPNFQHVPGIPYEELPAWYQHASVTVIPFKDSDLVAPVNPIKMFESLAAGTPVVARAWAELQKLEAPVRLAADAESMAAAIREEIDLKASNKKSYEAFLARYSWSANLDNLLARIQKIQGAKSERNI